MFCKMATHDFVYRKMIYVMKVHCWHWDRTCNPLNHNLKEMKWRAVKTTGGQTLMTNSHLIWYQNVQMLAVTIVCKATINHGSKILQNLTLMVFFIPHALSSFEYIILKHSKRQKPIRVCLKYTVKKLLPSLNQIFLLRSCHYKVAKSRTIFDSSLEPHFLL